MSNRIEYAGLVFTDDEIAGGEAYSATSLLCDSLEIGTLSVDLYVRDPDTWAALAAFRRNDKLTYYHKDKLRGTYYIEKVERTSKFTFSIYANDAVALLDQSNHMGGIYAGQTVREIVKDICNIPYFIQSRFADIKLYGWLPIATRRANLAQVLFAIGASAKVDNQGALRIESLWDGTASDIPQSRIFMGDKVEYDSKVSEVSVIEHQYIFTQEEKVLFEGTLLQGDMVQFSEPIHGLKADGFTILESGANYAKLSAGTGKLTGLAYAHTTRDVRRSVSDTDLPNVVEVKEATLVSLVNSAAVSDRLAGYYAFVETMQADVIQGNEEPGDVVTFEHPFGGEAFGCVNDMSITMGGRLVAEERTLIGYRPPKFDGDEIINKEVILTGSGEFTIPENAGNTARVVLISKGEDGSDGVNGSDGETVHLILTSEQVSSPGTHTKGAGTGGEGGEGGVGGVGGKILEVDLSVTPGQKFQYSTVEDDSIFGDYNSVNGSVSEIGYTSPISGVTYAKKGADGQPGKKGGNGSNSESVPGDTGEGTEAYNGGAGADVYVDKTRYQDRYFYGSGGGGAAFSAPGGDASEKKGGNGAPGSPGQDGQQYGCGGNGGNGGAGGGGGGGVKIEIKEGFSGGSSARNEGGIGGEPGQAGRGKEGCVILYYSESRKMDSGWFRDNRTIPVLDRLGRRIIV